MESQNSAEFVIEQTLLIPEIVNLVHSVHHGHI